MSYIPARISSGGRVVIPAEYRRALGLQDGDEVLLSLEENEIRITTRLQALRRAQSIVAQYTPDREARWSDELITERRAETARE